MAKTDYEQVTKLFRGQIEDMWNKRKADQLRSQIDDVRRSVDELVKNYNRVMATGAELLGDTQRRLARQARENAEEMTETMGVQGFSWWIPVAILGAIGVAAWLYNMTRSHAPEGPMQQTPNFQAGFQPPRPPSETPFPEQR